MKSVEDQIVKNDLVTLFSPFYPKGVLFFKKDFKKKNHNFL